jgi:hypothetical protein
MIGMIASGMIDRINYLYIMPIMPLAIMPIIVLCFYYPA